MEKILVKRKYFKLLFIVYVFINTLALGYFGININPLFIIVMIYGLSIIIFNLIKGEIFYSKNHLLLIALYGILLAFATYMNKDYSSNNSYIIAIMQMLIFVLLFAQPKSMSLKDMKKELKLIIPTTCILVGVASFISLLMYFLNISGSQNGWYIGLVGDRLFGVYFNCNPASFLAIIVILLSLVAIKNHYKGEALYYMNIIIQLSYIILTQCRAAIIILAVITTAVLYYHFFRSQEMSNAKKLVLNLSICLCMLFGSFVVNKVAFVIPQLQGAVVEENNRFQFEKVKEIVSLVATRQLQNIPKIIQLTDEISSGRITLAKDSIEVWQKNPIQGIGAGNFRNMLVDVTHDKTWGQQILHSHNVFMESLIICGIFGFMLFIFFFIKTLFTTRDVLIKYRNKSSYYIVLLFIMIFVSEFIGGLFDFGVFYVYSLSATLAWIFLGYIYWLNDQHDLSLIDNNHIAVFNKYELLSIQYKKEDLESVKPEFLILDQRMIDEDYVVTVQYILGQSIFVYDVYYTLNDSQTDKEKIDKMLMRDFYQLIKDEIQDIYSQSHIL
ncbi:MAG: O-antigen ligase family protein [Longibaculum sp.]